LIGCQVAVALKIEGQIKRAETILLKTALPRPDRLVIEIQNPRNVLRRQAVIQQQKRIRATNLQRRSLPKAQRCFERQPLRTCKKIFHELIRSNTNKPENKAF